jgi:Flp pilus assembly protein TadD
MTISRCARGILFLLLSALAVEGCSRYTATHVARGDAYFARQSYGEAIDEYTKASRFQTDDPHIVRQLGFAHKALGHRPDAYAYLQKARDLNPADTSVGVTLASMLLADGLFGQAVNEASAVLRPAPNNLEALNLLGSAYLAKRDPAKALETFRKILDLAPRDARSHYLVGLALLAQSNVTEATRSFQAALSLSPSFVDPLAQLVRIDLDAKRPDAAVARVQKQIAIAGDSAKLHELLGTVYLARGERERADAAFRKAIELSPRSADSFARLGDLDLAAGKYNQALAIAESSLKLDPKNLKARLTEGVAYEQKGDKKRAKEAYEAALAVNPRYSDAANNLAMLLVNEDSTSGRALELAEIAKASSPEDPRISDTLGWVLYKRGDYKRAVALFADAAAKMPDEPTVEYHLGVARLKAGDAAGARDALNRALNSRSAFPEREAARKALASVI